MNGRTASGSQVVSALETAWSAIQYHHPEIPDVVIIIGSGVSGRRKFWGSTIHNRWTETTIHKEDDDSSMKMVPGRRTEIFIAGERLAIGAALTFQTLLHEATHVLANERKVQDTSRQGRYHNKEFVVLAKELGLELPAGAVAHSTAGWSMVELTEATLDEYRDEIQALERAITVHLDTPVGLTVDASGNLVAPPSTTPTSRNLTLARCQCEEPRKIRIAPKTLAVAGITCNACGEEFQMEDS
jgi:hypothetical protein